ncbi:hypothetical protein [Halomarina oriensis]|uniref:Uncharacterized protein n=1 Tax=Halomarina oriensis TaxID=671145 RepID=A0A6B0GWK4_9EURY|nr:hypothetical protein [Halomarina oriensis]MWG36525.1 hypothetical protein [Halomarina oriensis]
MNAPRLVDALALAVGTLAVIAGWSLGWTEYVMVGSLLVGAVLGRLSA